VVCASQNTGRTHSFDSGAAWMCLALQGSEMDLVVHGMEGFDYARAHALTNLPADYQVECMIAVGHHGRVEDLPEEYRSREQTNLRKPISEFTFEGFFTAPSQE